MNTQKLNTLAHTIINYSLHLKENSKVLIDFTKEASPLVEELIKEGKKVGAIMSLDMYDSKLACLLADTNTAERIELIKKRKEFEVENYDAFIHINYTYNDYESKNFPKEEYSVSIHNEC